jgi:hypothetical protein
MTEMNSFSVLCEHDRYHVLPWVTVFLLDLDTGQPLPYRSKVNVTGTVTTLQGHAGVDVHYRTASEEVLAYPLDPRQNILVFDLRLDYRLVGVLWQLKVSNLFNTFYTNVLERNPGAPRMIGLTAVYGL